MTTGRINQVTRKQKQNDKTQPDTTVQPRPPQSFSREVF